MKNPAPLDLSRRERQIMETVYACGQASVNEVLAALPDPPSYSAVRAILNMLADKGHLRRIKQGKKFLYEPTVPAEKVRRSALRNLLATFFGGSAVQAMAAMIENNAERLSKEDLDRLEQMIREARKGGR